MEFSCECQSEKCKVKINMTLDEFLHVSDSRCLMIAEECKKKWTYDIKNLYADKKKALQTE